jgi:hypothetical protein
MSAAHLPLVPSPYRRFCNPFKVKHNKTVYIPTTDGLERLLDTLSLILSGETYRSPGGSAPAVRTELSLVQMASSTSQYPSRSSETIQLALDTLATFDFNGSSIAFDETHI